MSRIRTIGRLRAGGDFSAVIRALFAAGEQGIWDDPSDQGVYYQDSAGTTQGAVGQGVGLVLDKSRGAVLGSELIVNGAPTSTTTGWTGSGSAILTATASGLRVENGAALTAGASQTIATVIGKVYKLSFDLTGKTAGNDVVVRARNGTTLAVLATRTVSALAAGYTLVFTATSTDTQFQTINSSGALSDFHSINTITTREIPGNHLLQATSGSRPMERLDGSYYAHQLDGLDDNIASASGGGGTAGFFFCAAVKFTSVGFIQSLLSDAGANTGYRVRITAANTLELAAGNGTAFTPVATTTTVSANTGYVLTAEDDGTNLKVQINNGPIATVARPVVAAGTAAVTIGKDNGAASNFMEGYIYQGVYRKDSAPDAATREQVKRFVAGKAGIAL